MTEELQEQRAASEARESQEALAKGIMSQVITSVARKEPSNWFEVSQDEVAASYSFKPHEFAGFRQVIKGATIQGSELGLEDNQGQDHFGFVAVRSLGKFRRGVVPLGGDYDDKFFLAFYPSDSPNKTAHVQPLSLSKLQEMEPNDLEFVQKLADHLVTKDAVPKHLQD